MRPLKKKILLVAQAEGEEVGGFEWQKRREEAGGGGGRASKSCLPAGGGNITFEQPHPSSLWVRGLCCCVILTGVSSSSSGETNSQLYRGY